MNDTPNQAPGQPGIEPRWTSSAKVGVGTSLSPESHVWFTLSHGILNEIYYPRVDQACTRDLGLIVTDGESFFSEEKRHAEHRVALLADGVPAYSLTSVCLEGRYRIEKQVLADPHRDVVLQHIRFAPLQGAVDDYRLYVLLAPHLANCGAGNTAWVGDYKGVPMLMAERAGTALAMACSTPWLRGSAGFVGMSDGWQDLIRHKRMTWTYDRAADGNVALTGEVDLPTTADGFVIAVGFGRNAAEAGQRARASLMDGFEVARTEYVRQWLGWQERTRSLDVEGAEPYPLNLWKISTAVLRTHEAKRFPGGLIASLAIPWGDTKGDEDLGGYHLVWPRDLCESAGGLLAIGALDDARRVIDYLRVTQEGDGHWPQNMWLDGRAYWGGVQMDETAYVILLVDLARREGALEDGAGEELWPMVRRAAGYLVRNGPVTPQDRWEEDPGYSPFTLAVEISALLAAADLADANGEGTTASFLRETADVWNAGIERWTYVTDTALARATGVDGYYVRIAPPETSDASSPVAGFVAIKNRPPSDTDRPAAQTVSPDALALVRFGLRSADDLRIANTVKVIDALLKVETPFGPAWYRYNDDGYGEHEDGTAFDGTGIGRPWPLLTGERAHYELAAGRRDVALRLLAAMEGFANEGGLIPEQIWDADDIPERELACGRPSGSAMPLAWAHAEYIKLRRSLRDGRVFDLPPQTVARYVNNESSIRRTTWRFNNKCSGMRPGDRLRVETLAPARVQWTITTDEGRTDPRVHEAMTRDTGLGVYIADLPTEQMESGATIAFTFYWPEDDRWEGIDYSVEVLLD